MATMQKNIEVAVPVSTAYNQWTQFEEFPLFMAGVEEVQQLDDKRLRWLAQIGPQKKEWYAQITEQIPDHGIAWASDEGAKNTGRVLFEPMAADRTRITLQVEYMPEDLVENVGDKLGFVSRRVEGDLERFKQFIEARGIETGAWRGAIRKAS